MFSRTEGERGIDSRPQANLFALCLTEGNKEGDVVIRCFQNVVVFSLAAILSCVIVTVRGQAGTQRTEVSFNKVKITPQKN